MKNASQTQSRDDNDSTDEHQQAVCLKSYFKGVYYIKCVERIHIQCFISPILRVQTWQVHFPIFTLSFYFKSCPVLFCNPLYFPHFHFLLSVTLSHFHHRHVVLACRVGLAVVRSSVKVNMFKMWASCDERAFITVEPFLVYSPLHFLSDLTHRNRPVSQHEL